MISEKTKEQILSEDSATTNISAKMPWILSLVNLA